MEALLKIAYSSDFKTYPCTREYVALREARQNEIQKQFAQVAGIKVDYVKQGVGTTNDGNTSRRFFENPSVTAEITSIDERLIERFGTILDTINCNSDINVHLFETFCRETAELYVELYGWYPMTTTVHKVLIHGPRIIADASLPIGLLSEEAQEAQNKVYRYSRLNHSRKMSRVKTNEDVMHFMLASSDPFLHSFRRPPRANSTNINANVLQFLLDRGDSAQSSLL